MPLPDLFVASAIPAALRDTLAERFVLHDGDAPPETRAIIGGGTMRVDAALIDRLPALAIIAVHGVGHDGIDLEAARSRDIPVTVTADILTEDVADLAVALLLAAERRLVINDRVVREGGWQVPLARRASGRRIGIFGLGAIGTAIARRLEGFGCEIAYTARSAKPVSWRREDDLAALAHFADALILAAPGGDATRHAVDAAILRALGAEGLLVNIARGSLVDEPALIAALADGTIAGAALDVFADEPAVPAALRESPRVILSPHQGSATVEARAAMQANVLANLDAVMAGRPPLTPLD